MSMTQFHLNEANARTVHKLQGKSLKYVVINSFKNFGHWAYVALLLVKALNGLFLRSPVDFSKCTGMDNQVRQFMDRMKDKKLTTTTYLFENTTLNNDFDFLQEYDVVRKRKN
jgi:hypothetical protein